MHKAISFVRLDFITVKPYLTVKNLCLFVGVALIVLVVNHSAAGAIGLLMAFAALYASYPFAIGEKSNMDVLYTTLSIRRNTVVLGRYLFALALDILAGLFTFVFSFVVLTVMRQGMDLIEALATILVLFFLFSVIQAIQLPIYFKLNYTKAKMIAYLPFVVFPLAIMAGSHLFNDLFSLDAIAGLFVWLSSHLAATVLTGVVVWLAIMLVSYKVAVLLYQKREF